LTYAIGKNNLQNEYVTNVYAQKEDYWFHVKDAPGAHVVVNAKTLTEPILRKAAMLAAYYSSLRFSSSIPVDYTKIKYIKKIPGVAGYKVTYQKQQTIYIDIDEQKLQTYLKNV
jgi:predicted ribosome quality control (RQC) complex YloA/Tae2 family protein